MSSCSAEVLGVIPLEPFPSIGATPAAESCLRYLRARCDAACPPLVSHASGQVCRSTSTFLSIAHCIHDLSIYPTFDPLVRRRPSVCFLHPWNGVLWSDLRDDRKVRVGQVDGRVDVLPENGRSAMVRGREGNTGQGNGRNRARDLDWAGRREPTRDLEPQGRIGSLVCFLSRVRPQTRERVRMQTGGERVQVRPQTGRNGKNANQKGWLSGPFP
jgi:hypothetical protein